MSIKTNSVLLTRREAARQLGVSDRRITALCEAGDLTSYASGGKGVLIDADSVRRQARWAGNNGRPYSDRMAFAALYLISGEPVPWIGRQQRYRVKGYLRDIDAENLTRRTFRRARAVEYWCRDSLLVKIGERIRISAATGELADIFQLTGVDLIEGYIASDKLERFALDCRLKRDAMPVRVRLRAADFLPDGEGPMPVGVCAADLAESDDPRERRAGLEKLGQLLEEFNSKEKQV
jgi:excisionase family DNA binding protein